MTTEPTYPAHVQWTPDPPAAPDPPPPPEPCFTGCPRCAEESGDEDSDA